MFLSKASRSQISLCGYSVQAARVNHKAKQVTHTGSTLNPRWSHIYLSFNVYTYIYTRTYKAILPKVTRGQTSFRRYGGAQAAHAGEKRNLSHTQGQPLTRGEAISIYHSMFTHIYTRTYKAILPKVTRGQTSFRGYGGAQEIDAGNSRSVCLSSSSTFIHT